MVVINDINKYKEEISKHEVCLVKIGTSWCGPCKVVQKNIEDIEKLHKNVYFIEVDADEAEEIVDMYNVRNVPAILVLKSGEEVSRTVGVQTKEQLETKLTNI